MVRKMVRKRSELCGWSALVRRQNNSKVLILLEVVVGATGFEPVTPNLRTVAITGVVLCNPGFGPQLVRKSLFLLRSPADLPPSSC